MPFIRPMLYHYLLPIGTYLCIICSNSPLPLRPKFQTLSLSTCSGLVPATESEVTSRACRSQYSRVSAQYFSHAFTMTELISGQMRGTKMPSSFIRPLRHTYCTDYRHNAPSKKKRPNFLVTSEESLEDAYIGAYIR